MYVRSLYAAVNHLLILKMPPQNSLDFDWSMFSSIDPCCIENVPEFTCTFTCGFRYYILQDHRRLSVCLFRIKSPSLKRVTIRIFKSNFKEESKKFDFNFSNNKASNKFENHQRIYIKYKFKYIEPQ